ncbi:MAG: hypothetical protein J0H54_01555, partial [Rhizobiales bacterium]|nr:hypothetical protein [Hyphomicrobiales bacterium]
SSTVTRAMGSPQRMLTGFKRRHIRGELWHCKANGLIARGYLPVLPRQFTIPKGDLPIRLRPRLSRDIESKLPVRTLALLRVVDAESSAKIGRTNYE